MCAECARQFMQTRSVGAGMAAVLVIAIVYRVLIEFSVRGMHTGRLLER